jgi:hypothetical protein
MGVFHIKPIWCQFWSRFGVICWPNYWRCCLLTIDNTHGHKRMSPLQWPMLETNVLGSTVLQIKMKFHKTCDIYHHTSPWLRSVGWMSHEFDPPPFPRLASSPLQVLLMKDLVWKIPSEIHEWMEVDISLNVKSFNVKSFKLYPKGRATRSWSNQKLGQHRSLHIY